MRITGDSGGPLMALDNSERLKSYYYLAGVVSFGPSPCGLEGWPGVYTVRSKQNLFNIFPTIKTSNI